MGLYFLIQLLCHLLIDMFTSTMLNFVRPSCEMTCSLLFVALDFRFMKLRLDRVLTESFEAASLEEALASNPTKLEFEKPEKWVAPYPKYEYGWWEAFLPAAAIESKV